MDGVSAAASIIGIASVGVQISIKLITFSNQVGTAPSRIRLIGNDVSLTSGVLQQLGDLMHQQNGKQDDTITIFSKGGLLTTQASATTCKGIFEQLEDALKKASRQIRESGAGLGTRKVVLSKTERLRFPFLQPSLDNLRGELRDARGTLLLILQVTTLAYSKKLAELNRPTILSREEQVELMRSILAMHKNRAEAHEEEDEEDHESVDKKDREQISIDHRASDKDIDNGVVPPIKGPLDIPAALADPGTADAFASKPDESKRQIPDFSNNDQEGEVADLKDSHGGSRSNSPMHDSTIKRPPVCKFPWSSDGKDARFSRSRSRGKIRDKSSGRGRRRSRSSSFKSIIRLRSRSLEGPPDILKEAWIVSPSVQPQKSAFRMYWFAERLPLKSEDVEEEYERLKRKSKKSITDQMIQLTNKEREFIDEWFNDELEKQRVRLYVVAVALEKIKSSDVVLSSLAKRRIRLIIERHPIEDFPRFSSPRRRPRPGPGLIDLNRPTFIKVDRQFVEPDVLDDANLPWEWDRNNSRFMIIKKWLPELETDRLFEETTKLRARRGNTKIHNRKRDKVLALERPTYIKVERKLDHPDILEDANLPWKWDQDDPDYIVIKKYIPEQEQDQLFEKSQELREKRDDIKVVKEYSSKSKWRPAFDFLRKKRAFDVAKEERKHDQITIPIEYRPSRRHSKSRSRSSSIIDVQLEPLGLPTVGSSNKDIKGLGDKKRALLEASQKEGREGEIKGGEIADIMRQRRDREARERTQGASATTPGTALSQTSSITPPASDEERKDEGYATVVPYSLALPADAGKKTAVPDHPVGNEDTEEEEDAENGQEIINRLLGKYTTLFDEPATDVGGWGEKTEGSGI